MTAPHARRSRTWLVVPAAAVLAWWAASLRPFTVPALVVTLAAGVAALAAGRRFACPGGDGVATGGAAPNAGARVGLALWAGLALALAALELVAFVQLPRSAYPTLSSLANSVFDSHPVRAAAFLLWLAAGVGIARR